MKKCNFWKICAIVFGFFVLICGILDFVNRKLRSKNIDCDEYDDLIENDFYIDDIDIDEDMEEYSREKTEVTNKLK